MSVRELAMAKTRRQLYTAAIGRARGSRSGGWSLSAAGATAARSGNLVADHDRESQRPDDGEPLNSTRNDVIGGTVELAARLTGMVWMWPPAAFMQSARSCSRGGLRRTR